MLTCVKNGKTMAVAEYMEGLGLGQETRDVSRGLGRLGHVGNWEDSVFSLGTK